METIISNKRIEYSTEPTLYTFIDVEKDENKIVVKYMQSNTEKKLVFGYSRIEFIIKNEHSKKEEVIALLYADISNVLFDASKNTVRILRKDEGDASRNITFIADQEVFAVVKDFLDKKNDEIKKRKSQGTSLKKQGTSPKKWETATTRKEKKEPLEISPVLLTIIVVLGFLVWTFFFSEPSHNDSGWNGLSDKEKEWYQDNYGNGQYDAIQDAISDYND